MTLYCGIDLHANNSVISVLDNEDQVRYEKRLPNDLAVIKDSLRPDTNSWPPVWWNPLTNGTGSWMG